MGTAATPVSGIAGWRDAADGRTIAVAPTPEPAAMLRQAATELEADIARRPHPWALAPVATQDAVNAALRRMDARHGTLLGSVHRARCRIVPGDPGRGDPDAGVNRRLLLATIRRVLLALDDAGPR